jgi:ferrochelatase
MSDPKRVAVVLFNLGGPDSPEAIQPFLFNLFNDPAIIDLAAPFRWLLAKLISKRRAPIAAEIYEHLGGRSPLLPLTQDQADALTKALERHNPGVAFEVAIAMRYWHPFSEEAAARVKAFDPDTVVLLPLYPQYSKTTSGSSIRDFERALHRAGVKARCATVCCYPTEPGLIESHVHLIREALGKVPDGQTPRVLFSAHGLPKKVVDGGDPYQWQVEQTSAAVAERLGVDGLDWQVCYQSRVGPLEWIGPSTEDEIARAGRDGAALIVTPIAFVSEHSETLVELDIEYGELAEEAGVPTYIRVPALATEGPFIDGLAAAASAAARGDDPVRSDAGGRVCPKTFSLCPHHGEPCALKQAA